MFLSRLRLPPSETDHREADSEARQGKARQGKARQGKSSAMILTLNCHVASRSACADQLQLANLLWRLHDAWCRVAAVLYSPGRT